MNGDGSVVLGSARGSRAGFGGPAETRFYQLTANSAQNSGEKSS